jgi:hypothetical protein
MTVGVAIALPCGIIAGVSAKTALKVQASAAVPGGFGVHLARGDWEIYELTGTVSGSSVGPFSYSKVTGGPVTIDSTDIRVMDPEGGLVVPRQRFSTTSFETFATGSLIYTGVASFPARAAGMYQISITSSQPGRVVVARPPLAGIGSVLGWAIGAILGGVLFIVGLIMLILDLDRRRRASFPTVANHASPGYVAAPPQLFPGLDQPARPGGGTPAPIPDRGNAHSGVSPAWYTDPSGKYQLRYWNGMEWTQHVSTGGKATTDPL